MNVARQQVVFHEYLRQSFAADELSVWTVGYRNPLLGIINRGFDVYVQLVKCEISCVDVSESVLVVGPDFGLQGRYRLIA
jgi:hypothetical protein